MVKKELTFRQALRVVLADSAKLNLSEIQREIEKRQLRRNITPSGLRSVLNKDYIKGIDSEFTCDDRGFYRLRVQENIQLLGRSKQENENKVLVFEHRKLGEIGNFHGVRKNYERYVQDVLQIENPIFLEREKAERTVYYKQVVSYVIVKYKDHLLRFTRHNRKKNRYLDYVDGKYSIGFGGHVQLTDLNLFSVSEGDSGYLTSLQRELVEEAGIVVNDLASIDFIGVLNDNSTPRGRRHFAFIHLLELKNPIFKSIEKWVQQLQLVSFEQISNEFAQYEYWSKICLQAFFEERLKRKCFIVKSKETTFKKMPQYLSVVGEIGAGKSEICSILEKKYDYIHVPCSRVLVNILTKINNIELQRKELQDAGYEFITSLTGHEILAKGILDFIRDHGPDNKFLFDGLRYPETLTKLEYLLDTKIPSIYIETTIDTRYRNYLSRENENKEFSDFQQLVDHPVERNIERFLPLSNILIFNNGPYNTLAKDVEEFFTEEFFNIFLINAWDKNAIPRNKQLQRGNDLTFFELNMPQIIERLEYINDFPHISVLDVGCGTGHLTSKIGDCVDRVQGIDPSSESIRIAGQFKKDGIVDFECTLVEDYKPDTKFDAIIANMTLHTVKELEPAIKKIYDLLVVGGSFIFTIPHPRYHPLRENQSEIFSADGYEYKKDSFHKIPFCISMEPDPLPSPTPYFHRPIDKYETILDKAGFWLMETKVLYPSAEVMKQYGKRWDYPHTFLGVAWKPLR